MKPTHRLSRRPLLFTLLMLASLLLSLLPPSWTRWAGTILQPVAWLQWSTAAATRGVARSAEQLASGDDAETARLRRQLEELQRQVLHQSAQIEQLESNLDAATNLRRQLREPQARLIVAPVIAGDPSPLRAALRIGRGSEHGVVVGDWVAAALDPAERPEGTSARDLLLRQWLVGQVSRVLSHTSDVTLTTDRSFGPVRVRLARALPDGKWQTADREALVSGGGGGRLEIRNATVDFAATGFTTVLALLYESPPALLMVGAVQKTDSVLDAPMHYNLQVRPAGDARRLSHVYVISIGP